jgi:hypothetical protein
MSTRAIVTAVSSDGKEKYSIYCHGDGYPDVVGELVRNFVNLAPRIDGNVGRQVQHAAFGHGEKEGRYHKFSQMGQAYSTMFNVSAEPSKFISVLIGYMQSKGYGGVYLTDRDPIAEAAKKGHGDPYGTDIDWFYKVVMDGKGGLKLQVYKSTDYGPKHELYKTGGKSVMGGSLQRFVLQHPFSNPCGKKNPMLSMEEARSKVKEVVNKYDVELVSLTHNGQGIDIMLDHPIYYKEQRKMVKELREIKGLWYITDILWRDDNPCGKKNPFGASIYLFHLKTQKAKDWVAKNVPDPVYWGDALTCDHRYVEDLAIGMRDEGGFTQEDVFIEPAN